jgi:carboxypeptidase family protein/TonB-dependent receptor-like protein
MSSRIGALVGALTLSFGLVTTANAQINPAHITGVVKDAQGAVLPGVSVTATSPALLGKQTVVTEANGNYRFPNLSAGTYDLSFELQGFQTLRRQNIVLSGAQTLSVDVTLQIAALQESVTVLSEAPVVDTQSTSVGYVQTTAQLIGVPSSTDLWGALAQTPGVRMGGVDVGGSHKSQQSNYEAYGVRNQARVVNDGVDTTEGSGGAGFYQDYFAQNEVAVSAAGGDVTMNTPGAAIVASIKSGGDRFSGLENLAYEPGKWVGNNIDSATQARGFTGQPNLEFWEGHVDLGGPILTQKAWFYASYNHFKINKAISGVNQAVATDLGLFNNFTTKESYKPSSKDTFLGYYQWGRKEKPLRGLSATTPPESALAQNSPSWVYNGRWQRTWSNRMFTEVNLGNFGYDWPMAPNVDYKTSPPRHDNGTGNDVGAGWNNAGACAPGCGPGEIGRSKPQFYANMTYYLPTAGGSHDLKAGFEFLNDRSLSVGNGASGPILYLDQNGATNTVRITDFGDPSAFGSGWTQGADYDRRYAGYFQDRFSSAKRITLTLGLRYDYQRPYYGASIRNPLITSVWSPVTVPAASLITRNTFAPRVGISWDPIGDNRSVIKGFWGRFYYNLADVLRPADPGAPNYKEFRFNDLNGNRLWDGPQEFLSPVPTASAGGATTTLDPNLKVPYADEVEASFDRQFWGESSVRVAYVRKMIRNDFANLNIARIGKYTVPVTIAVNTTNYDSNNPKAGQIVGQQQFQLNDIPGPIAPVNQITNIPDSLGGGDYNYDTVSAAFTKRFSHGLFLNGSFDYQWRNDLRGGQFSGTFTTSNDPLNADPVGIGTFLNANPSVSTRQKTTTWSSHLQARYEFKYDIGAAVNYSGQSGWPYARAITVTLPNAGSTTFFAEDLSNNRSDTIHLLALRVDKAVKVQKMKFMVMLDLFNVLNSNAVTNFNLLNGANFNRINATADPRTAQIGVRIEF